MKKFFVLFLVFIPMFAFGQNALTLDRALNNSTAYLKGKLPAQSRVAVLNFTSEWPQLSNYVIGELMAYLVNAGSLIVVDRQNLETIRKEMNLQMSGDVSDETALSIGKLLGAQTIISGGIQPLGSTYRMQVQAISVETAQVQGMQNVDVLHDNRVAALTGIPVTGATASTPIRNYVVLSNLQWQTFKGSDNATTENNTTVRQTVKMESIDGQDREVLTVDINLANGGIYCLGQAEMFKDTLVEQLQQGSGVRFKALGDGKKWRLELSTSDIRAEEGFYYTTITTKKGKVVEFDIPYSKLKQPDWGKKRPFNKNRIDGLKFQRYSEEGRGASTIKIFDLEIY